jgi:MFS family permease
VKNRETQAERLQSYMGSPARQRKLYKRTLLVVMSSQLLSGAGLAAGVTAGALLAQDMFGTGYLAGLPLTLFTLGSAAAAMLVGRLSQRSGRRFGLGAGFLAGGVGAVGVVIAATLDLTVLFFVSLLIYGSGSATNLQARYAGTDLAGTKEKATAASLALASTTIGAVAGPNLAESMGVLAQSIGVPSLAGIFILAAAAYTLAGAAILMFLRPDPLLVAKAIAQGQRPPQPPKPSQSLEESNQIPMDKSPRGATPKRGIIMGVAVMVSATVVMAMIMAMTPIHMEHNHFSLGQVGLVIGLHIGFMYLPSLVTGLLVDRIGRKKVAIASGAVLILAALIAAVAPSDLLVPLVVALSLLGLGWNLGLISGTAFIIDAADPSNQAKVQGYADVSISLAAAAAGLMSGIIVAGLGFMALALIGGIVSTLLIVAVVSWRTENPASTFQC